MIQVKVNSEDLEVMEASALPSLQGDTFTLLARENGSFVNIPKSTLEDVLEEDGLGNAVLVEAMSIEDTTGTISLKEAKNGVVFVADVPLTEIQFNDVQNRRISAIFSTSSNKLGITCESADVYCSTSNFTEGVLYLADIIVADRTILVKVTSFNNL